MSLWAKVLLYGGGLLTWGLFFADALDRARRVWDAPETALRFWGLVGSMFIETHPLAWAILFTGAACFLAATSEWWLRWAWVQKTLTAIAERWHGRVGEVERVRPRQPPDAATPSIADDLIPLTDFLRLAEQHGWHFTEPPFTSQAIEICRRLREEARNDKITFYGVEKRWQSDELVRNEPRAKIDAAHWRDFQIDCTSCFELDPHNGRIIRVAADNWLTRTRTSLHHVTEPPYVNLHLERAPSERWLKRSAAPESSVDGAVVDRGAWFKDAVFYLVHDRWPTNAKDPIAGSSAPEGKTYSDRESRVFLQETTRILRNLKQYAFDGRYAVHGKPRNTMTVTGDVSRHGVVDLIPKEHWRHYQVGISTFILDAEHLETSRDGLMPDSGSFIALRVSRRQTEELKELLRTDPLGMTHRPPSLAEQALQESADLEIKNPLLRRRYADRAWQVAVCNGGPAVAEAVRFSLLSIDPDPRDPTWPKAYPYNLPPVGSHSTLGVAINPKAEEVFELFCTKRANGQMLMMGLDPFETTPLVVKTGENWQLEYEVTCANADRRRLKVRIWFDEYGDLIVGRV